MVEELMISVCPAIAESNSEIMDESSGVSWFRGIFRAICPSAEIGFLMRTPTSFQLSISGSNCTKIKKTVSFSDFKVRKVIGACSLNLFGSFHSDLCFGHDLLQGICDPAAANMSVFANLPKSNTTGGYLYNGDQQPRNGTVVL